MGKIKFLDENLINQIAAGEVVDRPASVVKELLENSLDAGASQITLEVEEGGIKLIRITDNGSGMSDEDARICLQKHTTSKIASLEDLENVRTLGFRGEAVASIASVAKLRLITRREEDVSGFEMVVEGGKILVEKSVGTPVGTTFEVREIFYNTPARLKFLKSVGTEYQNILDCLINAAIAFPEVGFRMINDGKEVFDLAATNDELVRLRGLMGKNITDNLIEVFFGGALMKLKGYIGKPLLARASKNMQYFFVNNRPIKSHVLGYAVKQAYHSLLPKERYPVFFLKFEIDPSLVDVNIHPRKTEVRFKDEREIYRVLSGACGKSLETNILAPKIQEGTAVDYYQERKPEGLAQEWAVEATSLKVTEPVVVGVEEITASAIKILPEGKLFSENGEVAIWPEMRAEQVQREEVKPMKKMEQMSGVEEELKLEVIGQMNNSFILCRKGGDLVIVDQHAAHERIRYEKLMGEAENDEKVIQPLLTPINIEVSVSDQAILNSNKAVLDEIGLQLEHFGGNTFAIQAVPAFAIKSNPENLLHGLLDDLRNESVKGDFYGRKEKVLTYLACRSAVKFGDKLDPLEQIALIEQLEVTSNKFTCPHGRPTMVIMEENELWSRFGRNYEKLNQKEKFGGINC
ncbi:MAG: DNA mismatch repair endonuclease MutL [Candidatus Altimarinota bacterium]